MLYFGVQLFLAGTAVYSLWTLANVEEAFVKLAFKGIPMPGLTSMFFDNTEGFVAFLIPWLLYAVIVVVRGTATPRELIAYSSTLAAALITGTIAFGFGMILPWIGTSRSMNASFRLNLEERAMAFEAAERGDAAANLRLSEHYQFTTNQKDLANYYLQRAADLGSASAKNSLNARNWNGGGRKRLKTTAPPGPATPASEY